MRSVTTPLLPVLLLLALTACAGGDETGDPCTSACSTGDAICDPAGGLRACEGPAELGCFYWGPAQSCGDRQVCRERACACEDPCEPGQSICGPSGGVIGCVGPDEDGCYRWGDEQSWLQPPQWALLVSVSTHVVPHKTSPESGHWHDPLTQVSSPTQAMSHPPQ